jgi:hypothetical protein
MVWLPQSKSRYTANGCASLPSSEVLCRFFLRIRRVAMLKKYPREWKNSSPKLMSAIGLIVFVNHLIETNIAAQHGLGSAALGLI